MTAGSQSAYMAVYRILEETAFAGTVPPGCRGAVAGAIDRLTNARAPREHVALASEVSVALHLLWQAKGSRDASSIDTARAKLQEAGAAWLQMPMRIGNC